MALRLPFDAPEKLQNMAEAAGCTKVPNGRLEIEFPSQNECMRWVFECALKGAIPWRKQMSVLVGKGETIWGIDKTAQNEWQKKRQKYPHHGQMSKNDILVWRGEIQTLLDREKAKSKVLDGRFGFFARAIRETVSEAFSETMAANPGKTMVQCTKIQSAAWNALSEEEKEVYREKCRTVRDARRTLSKDHT